MERTRLYAEYKDIFLHDAILASCHKYGEKTAIVDTSVSPSRRISYAEYGDIIERVSRGIVAAGVRPGEVVAIYLMNCWEYAATFHATTLAGAIPTLLNPSYREREVCYQLSNSGAVMLVTDAPHIAAIDFSVLRTLRNIVSTRQSATGLMDYEIFLKGTCTSLPTSILAANEALAALPYSSGTTGLPKGVELTHENLLGNCYQYLSPGEMATNHAADIMLCFLPLYHIYGLNVCLNPILLTGGTLVLMPRFDTERSLDLLTEENITFLPTVPPVLHAFCVAAEAGKFPTGHRVRAAKCGAAPLAPELAKRFTALTGIKIRQGYGMTEASPVTHTGFIEDKFYRPDSIGKPVVMTECRVVTENEVECKIGEAGELIIRGPQVMRGYWNAPEATAQVLRDGWYWSGDMVVRDEHGFYKVVDRRKEMIKFKGFAIAPAEVEAVLLEHPAVRDCGVVGRPDEEAGESPCAFVVLNSGHRTGEAQAECLMKFVAERLTSYKQPREIRFVECVPRNPSGKILRKDLRAMY